MTAKHYGGPCIGGPDDGQHRAEAADSYEVIEHLNLREMLVDPTVTPQTRRHQYRWDYEAHGWHYIGARPDLPYGDARADIGPS